MIKQQVLFKTEIKSKLFLVTIVQYVFSRRDDIWSVNGKGTDLLYPPESP